MANTDGVLRFPYQSGATKITGAGEPIPGLPRGGYNNHWTRNLLARADGYKIYVTVGSGSNVQEYGAENEVRRANILELNPDELGDELVPDYFTSVREGGFYGWPYAYFGQNEEPRRKNERPDLVKKALVPDVPLGAHVAALGLAFYV